MSASGARGKRARLRPAAVLLALLCAEPAAAFVAAEGVFTPHRECPAPHAIRSGAVDEVRVRSGVGYEVRGFNRAGGDYVSVDVPEARPRARWVRLDCGTIGERAGSAPARFAPFFTAAARDVSTPAPPALDAFDRAVLDVCGAWGSRPSRAAFRAMLDAPELAADAATIYEALDGAVRGKRADQGRFKDELTALWFAESGFLHVFCGEPGETGLGGLHFHGRYLQMQERGWGGLAPCGRAEIAPPIYTVGVAFRTPAGRVQIACPKGYAHDLGARELLIAATDAFKQFASRARDERMCLYGVRRSGVEYSAVFVARAGAVRTFYPDATPSCPGRRAPQTCACAS